MGFIITIFRYTEDNFKPSVWREGQWLFLRLIIVSSYYALLTLICIRKAANEGNAN